MTPQSILSGGKPLKKSTMTGGVLYAALWLCSHNTWRNSTFQALKVFTMMLMVPLGLNVTNVTPHSIFNVAPGSQKKLLGQNASYVHFTAVDTFNCVHVDLLLMLYHIACLAFRSKQSVFSACGRSSVSLAFQMGKRPLCPNSPKSGKKKQRKDDKKDGDEPPPLPALHTHHAWSPSDMKGTGLSHKGQQIGQWSVQSMKEALEEWEYWESR